MYVCMYAYMYMWILGGTSKVNKPSLLCLSSSAPGMALDAVLGTYNCDRSLPITAKEGESSFYECFDFASI